MPITPLVHFQLSGEFGGAHHTLPLELGDNLIGTAKSCTVRILDRGVSRHHAQIEVGRDGLTVRDLDSKNGTFVNGRPVSSSHIGTGDELRFGAVRLRLGEIDPEDAELGLAIEAESSWTPEISAGDETSFFAQVGGSERAALELVEQLLTEFFATAERDLAVMLPPLVASLEASAGAWVEWHLEGARATMVAASGDVGELPSENELRSACRRGDSVAASWHDEPPLAWAAIASSDGEMMGLVLWGDFPTRRVCAPLLRCLVRLAMALRPEPLASGLSGGVERGAGYGGELQFPEGILPGHAPAMRALYHQMQPLLHSEIPVLIVGETGVGKEHLAETLHASSHRGGGPFVAINCAAIPAELLEAELFGIGKGVATGVQQRRGKFLEAHRGTLFLDEIGDMSPELQAKLLRVLQDKQVNPVGDSAQTIDVRVVAATNTDLARKIDENRFRQDLYYRIAGFVLRVPPLRERREDLPRLIGHFLHRFGRETGKSIRGLTVKALRAMTDHPWPGNVRQLEHELRRLAYLCPSSHAIDSSMLSDGIAILRGSHAFANYHVDLETTSLDEQIAGLERRLVRDALEQTGGNQTRAAKLLQISRNGLAKRIKRLDLEI